MIGRIFSLAFLGAWSVVAHGVAGANELDCETRIHLDADRITLEHRMTMTRASAYLEVLAMDSDADGDLSPAEQAAYFLSISEALAAGFDISLNGRTATLLPLGEVELEMPFTKIYRFHIDHPPDWRDGVVLEFHNDTFLEASGGLRIRVDAAESAGISFRSFANDEEKQRDTRVRYGAEGLADASPPAAQAAVFTQLRSSQLPAIGILLLLIGFCLVAFKRMRVLALLICVSGTGVIAFCGLRSPQVELNERAADRVFQGLHRQIYAAFKAPSESAIYDALAASLSGDLLEEVYLQIYGSMVKQDDGDVVVSIRRVKPLSSVVLPSTQASGFQVRHRWRVIGTVSHQGHTHARVSEYRALYSVARIDDSWRISDVETEDQKRTD